MNQPENPRAVIGANNPPDADPLLVEAQERVDTANRWLTERDDWAQWDAETADKANFFIAQVSATHAALDGQRLEEGRKFKAAQEAKYSAPLSLLLMAKDKLAKMRREWLKREDDRIAAEKRRQEEAAMKALAEAEEARKRAEAEAAKKGGDPLRAELQAQEAAKKAEEIAMAAAEAPEKAVIKGAFTTRATGLREVWSAEVLDLSEAFKHYNKKANPHKAGLEDAIRAYIVGVATKEARLYKDEAKAPPGIKFIKDRR